MGPLILDLTGLMLSSEEREILKHPQVGGIIFFARNYESPKQLLDLVRQIRQCSKHRLLLTVDQEGGRVQRFLSGFTPLPALGKIGQLYEKNPSQATQLAQLHGWLMASELLALGIDLSFAPLLDLNNGHNQVIGKRAFHGSSAIVTTLGRNLIQGIHHAGLCAVGKHFPGHGSVTTDTHTHSTIDARDYKTIEANDLMPFTQLSPYLDGIMASHIVYSDVDSLPCGFSSYWLQTILRKKLNFSAAIFTDDLSMQAVKTVGSITERVQLALQAGCDGLLICNNREDAISALGYLENIAPSNKTAENRLQKLFPRRTLEPALLRQSAAWHDAVNQLSQLNDN
jgi:beta-N-acetylhexosaminidase